MEGKNDTITKSSVVGWFLKIQYIITHGATLCLLSKFFLVPNSETLNTILILTTMIGSVMTLFRISVYYPNYWKPTFSLISCLMTLWLGTLLKIYIVNLAKLAAPEHVNLIGIIGSRLLASELATISTDTMRKAELTYLELYKNILKMLLMALIFGSMLRNLPVYGSNGVDISDPHSLFGMFLADFSINMTLMLISNYTEEEDFCLKTNSMFLTTIMIVIEAFISRFYVINIFQKNQFIHNLVNVIKLPSPLEGLKTGSRMNISLGETALVSALIFSAAVFSDPRWLDKQNMRVICPALIAGFAFSQIDEYYKNKTQARINFALEPLIMLGNSFLHHITS